MIVFGLRITSGVTLGAQVHKMTIYLSEMRLQSSSQSISSHRCVDDILPVISGPLKCHYLTLFDFIFSLHQMDIYINKCVTAVYEHFAFCCKQYQTIKHKCSYDHEAASDTIN